MTHYGIGQWTDFARGLVAGDELERMRTHLASGCAECRQTLSFCKVLDSVSSAMSRAAVPEAVVRQAYAIFPPSSAETAKRPLRLPLELIFDSFLAPAPAGLRSNWQVGWQGLYRAGDCSLDLRIEPELHTTRASIVGQISNHRFPNADLNNIPVYLKAGKLAVAQTRSNPFGEFQLDYEQQPRLQLFVYLETGSKCIQVPIRRVANEKPLPAARGLGFSVTRRPARTSESN